MIVHVAFVIYIIVYIKHPTHDLLLVRKYKTSLSIYKTPAQA